MTRRLAVVLVGVTIALVAAGCNGAELNQFRAAHGLPPLPAAEAEHAAAAIDAALAQAARRQSFVAQAHDVTAAELGASWHPGCPVGPDALVRLTLSHLGFDGVERTGDLIVARRVALVVIADVRDLFVAGFPIERMQPVAAYGGDDEASMSADNTSAFNCRAVAGSSSWSMHAYGEAIDVNPLINPSVAGGVADPPTGAPHADRDVAEPGKITSGSVAVGVFTSRGWGWGGNWTSDKDYQHFSSNGR
jgi:D-alanyl-D-alanine carboxypeptidase